MKQREKQMRVSIVSGSVSDIDVDILVVGGIRGEPLSGPAAQVDDALGGLLSTSIKDGAFEGKPFQHEWVFPSPLKARRILLIGAGKPQQYDVRMLRNLAGAAARQARGKKVASLCLALPTPSGVSDEQAAEVFVDGALSGLAEPDLYKDKSDRREIEQLLVWAPPGSESDHLNQAAARGKKIAEAVNFGRWLAEEPPNIMTPLRFAEEVSKHVADTGVDCEILDEEKIRAAGMGSLLSVAEGSQWPPRVVVLRYSGGSGPLLGLVGKGVTFDTGGISIKPAADMHYMKYDMCGAAAVVSAVLALANTKSKANVIAVAGLVENMPGGRATRPGDVVRAANGKSIEIVNTDAEGRLVLADALDLARKRGAERLVDVATLTGSIKIALGELASGVMGNPQGWVDDVLAVAELSGERMWQMPLYPEYKEKLKSNVADLMNTGGRFGGAPIAAAFLKEFVGDTPWAHLDIAGTAWTEKDSAWQTRGATGSSIRTLITLAEAQAAEHD
jgi:leucyl aminopeptidase